MLSSTRKTQPEMITSSLSKVPLSFQERFRMRFLNWLIDVLYFLFLIFCFPSSFSLLASRPIFSLTTLTNTLILLKNFEAEFRLK